MYNKQYGPMNLVCISVDWNVSIFYGSHVKKLICILALGLLWGGNAIAEECVQGNCKNGQGTYTWSDGQKYVGEWKDGKQHRQGTYTWSDGNKYVGDLKDNKFNGQGTFTFANGNKYVGEFKDNKFNGQATLTFANGNKYVGDLKDDKFNGQGTFTFANGKIKEGIWENDKLVREKSEIVRYEKIYNKCILENLKGQSDKEVIKIIKDACKNKASDPSVFDKLFN